MADLFMKSDCINLLRNKKILFIGDSNMRALYKDFVCLASENRLISSASLRRKCEKSYMNDTLVKCATRLDQGRAFFEMRRFQKNGLHIEFLFVTRCFNRHIEELLENCESSPSSAPNVIVMNSCLWDICRWGPNGVPEYQANLVKLMQQFNKHLPAQTLVIWTTTLPLSQKCKGGFLIKQVEFLEHTCRFDLMEANMCAHQAVVSHGYDVLDFHYYFRMQTHRRGGDGIHWTPEPVRYMTNLVLTHISLSWEKELPGNMNGVGLKNMKNSQTRLAPVAPSLKVLPSRECPIVDAVQELKTLQNSVQPVHSCIKAGKVIVELSAVDKDLLKPQKQESKTKNDQRSSNQVHKDALKSENRRTDNRSSKKTPPKARGQNSKHVPKSSNWVGGDKMSKNLQQYPVPSQRGKSNNRTPRKRGTRTPNKNNTSQQLKNYGYQNVHQETPHYSNQYYNGSHNFEDTYRKGFGNYVDPFQPTHPVTFSQGRHEPRGKVSKHSQRAPNKYHPYNVAHRPYRNPDQPYPF